MALREAVADGPRGFWILVKGDPWWVNRISCWFLPQLLQPFHMQRKAGDSGSRRSKEKQEELGREEAKDTQLGDGERADCQDEDGYQETGWAWLATPGPKEDLPELKESRQEAILGMHWTL